jgi:hypothetical protein
VCFYLHIIADEESQVDKYLSQRDQVVNSSEELSGEDAGTESKYNNSNKDDDAGSTDNNSVAPLRRPQKNVQVNKIKDARELFK